ncbi:MAG: ferrochelatase [Planctomycetes bacterium]|jgi:ferrochelatase|nr:ferrochelatase [Planctomycetota bacterium]MCL4729525.1 ferrochelatase [Planctomycetota bacterium]
MPVTDLFVVGFGGPTPGCCKRVDPCPGEAWCFVSGIFGHNEARRARVEEVVAHYRELGGFSRFNEITESQARAVGEELARRGHKLRVTVGYDHWRPYIADKVAELGPEFVTLVMSPHQSSVSWDGYLRRVAEGLEKLPESRRPRWAGVCEPWWNKPGFVDALADRAREAAAGIGADFHAGTTGLLLSAHAVPMPVVRTAPYQNQIEETSRLVAERLGAVNWMVGYQSAPGDSNIPWTTPFIERAIEQLAESGARKIVALPVGFLCDNVEVLYDLGIEGRRKADQLGVAFSAAQAVNTHPAFIRLLADQVAAKLP